MNKCIICDREANVVGSHITPASLIKNCVGKRNQEESYKFDFQSKEIDKFVGRENRSSTSIDIKEHHYTKDNILCQQCEDELGKIEGKFSAEFLQKFRFQQFLQNFDGKTNQSGVEAYTPKRIDKTLLYVYFYSIIYRYCHEGKLEDGDSYLQDEHLTKIKLFLHEYFYGDKNACLSYLEDLNLAVIFDKQDSNGRYVASSSAIKEPYTFIFCEAILLLYANELPDNEKKLYFPFINNILNDKFSIIVGPSLLRQTIEDVYYKIIVDEYNR